MINRKLNHTPLLPSEVVPGCEFRLGIETYTVTAVEGGIYTCERFGQSFGRVTWMPEKGTVRLPDEEEYEARVVPIDRLQRIDLWDYNNCLTDFRMKSLGFIAEPLGIYRRMVGEYEVTVKDCFYLNDCAELHIYGLDGSTSTGPVWYFHELQQWIYARTGQMLLTPMGKRLMLTKKAIDS